MSSLGVRLPFLESRMVILANERLLKPCLQSHKLRIAKGVAGHPVFFRLSH